MLAVIVMYNIWNTCNLSYSQTEASVGSYLLKYSNDNDAV